MEVLERYFDFVGERGLEMLKAPETVPRLASLFDPPSIEEIEGVAEAVGVPYVYLLAYNLDAALFPAFAPGCTQSVRRAAHNGGVMIHLVNEDSPLLLHLDGLHPRVVQIRSRTDGPHPDRQTVFFSLAGQIVGPNGVNDAGLTATSTTLLDGPEAKRLPSGLPHPQIVKQVLEESTSLDQALDIARQAPRAGRWSLLLSEADTDRAHYLEYDGPSILWDEPVTDEQVTTNHSVCEAAPGGTVPSHSAHRARRARSLLDDSPQLTVERAQAILRDLHDEGRGREVVHPTMNTIRRTDNVMSLVVEPLKRRLHVSDRVCGPGSAGLEEMDFLTVSYGRTSTSALRPELRSRALEVAPMEREEDVLSFTSSGVGLSLTDEVMRRYVVRALEEEAPSVRHTWVPSRCLIVGDGDLVNTLAGVIRDRGAEVSVVSTCAEGQRRLGHFRPDALGIVLPSPDAPPWQLNSSAWGARRSEALSGPFELLKHFGSSGTVFGVTYLGGGLGYENVIQGAGEQAGFLGLLKAMRREFEGLQVQALDLSPSEPPDTAAAALLSELDAGSPRLEVGLLRRKRIRLALAERQVEPRAPGPLPRQWLITGGARGVSARMALRLAKLYQPTLHLIGRLKLPAGREKARLLSADKAELDRMKQELLLEMKQTDPAFTPVRWRDACDTIDKSVEAFSNIKTIEALGCEVHYHAVDIGDREAVREVLATIGPVDGLIHGAGVENAKPFPKKTEALFEQTVRPKVDGIVNLLSLTEAHPFSVIVGFGSVSGRFGGHGQTDYAMANEGLSGVLSQYRARTGVRTCVVDWAAFSEVGLAARPSAQAFLKATGQAFMTPEEGANHLVRELWSGLQERKIVVCERLEALDLDGLLRPENKRSDWAQKEAAAQQAPLLDHLVMDERETVVERRLDPSESFLDQHRMGATPILPAVIGLEMMAEVTSLDGPARSLTDVRIEQPFKVPEGSDAVARVIRSGDHIKVVSTVTRPDGVVLEPDRVFLRGRQAILRAPASLPTPNHGDFLPYPYPSKVDRTPGARTIFHGPAFRCLKGVAASAEGGVARLVVPSPADLIPGAEQGWRIPVALLDGCLQAVGMLGRLLFSVVALPAGFGRVDVAPDVMNAAGQQVELVVRFHSQKSDQLIADLAVSAPGGTLLSVDEYRAQVVPDL